MMLTRSEIPRVLIFVTLRIMMQYPFLWAQIGEGFLIQLDEGHALALSAALPEHAHHDTDPLVNNFYYG